MSSTDRGLAVRPLTTDDRELLITATLGNVNWTGEERLSREDVLGLPELEHYTRLDPSRGDFGFAAVPADDSAPAEAVAVAWALLLPREDPGYGFVDEHTPEVSLWVAPDARGRGLGRRMLRLLMTEAVTRGFPGLSLSVESGNYARRLYLSEGFVDVPGREGEGVMTWAPSGPDAVPDR